MRVFLALITLFCLTLPASAEKSLKDVIQERQTAWAAAFNAGNPDRLVGFYTQNARYIAPGAEPQIGPVLIHERLSERLASESGLTLTTLTVTPSEPYVNEIGRADFTHVDEEGPKPRAQNYLVVWKMAPDGTWLHLIHMLNDIE